MDSILVRRKWEPYVWLLPELLKGLSYHTTWALWALIPVLFVLLCSLIMLARGELTSMLARGGL